MRILYLGGIYHVEYALYQEHKVNKELTVNFGGDNCGFYPISSWSNLSTVDAVDIIKETFRPDLTILRTWSGLDHLADRVDLVWAQEAHPIMDNGSVDPDESELRIPGGYCPERRHVAFTSPHKASSCGQHWLPYCVSSNWGDLELSRDIPVMVATNIPERGAHLKVRSLDILVKPIAEKYPDLLHVFPGQHSQAYSKHAPYLQKCQKTSYPVVDTTYILSRAKVYLSPTTIWYNEGFVSYKIYEAMNCGCAVITNNYPGMEYMMGKDREYLLYSNSAEETLSKFAWLQENPQECADLGQRAKEFVRKKYSFPDHLERIYNEVKNKITNVTLT